MAKSGVKGPLMWGSSSERFYVTQVVSENVLAKEPRISYNLDNLIVLGTLIRLQVVLELLGVVGDVTTLRGAEIITHTAVVREERSGSSNFSTHVADGGHARARQGLDARTSVLDNGTSTSLDSKDTGNLENDICDKLG